MAGKKPDGPTDAALRRTLGRAHAAYAALSRLVASFESGWSPRPAGGWIRKVHDGKKALCYLVPREGAFLVSLTVREAERTALLADPALSGIHEALASAKHYPEGFALRLEVDGPGTLEPAAALLERVAALRTRRARP